ncbi:MAG: peptidylprolyl isomerase [Elusimicrobia bacterium]|nr:peptidylprolyl isomerase [Elusimicrobiota bacterium]
MARPERVVSRERRSRRSGALLLGCLLAGLGACRSRGDAVLARVGKLTITRSEFEGKLAAVPVGYQSYVLSPSGRKQFLDVLIRQKLMLALAADSDAARSPSYKAERERLRAEMEQLLREREDDLLTRLWLDSLRMKEIMAAGAEEARDYHKKHPAEVGMSHILVASPEEAEALEKKIRAGTPFATVAKTNSLDYETAADGGKMSPAIYGEIIPDLEDVAFHMRVGDVGGPFKSKFGYHILRKDYEKNLPFEACQERIVRLLEKRKLDGYMQSLQEKYPVEVVDEQFR